MKERLNNPLIPLFVCSFLPLLTLILYPFGYSVSLASYEISSVFSAAICFLSVFAIKESNHNKTTRFFIAFLPLIQVANTAVYVGKTVTAVFMLICFICCAIISEKVILSNKAKIASVISSMLLLLIIVVFSLTKVFFSDFGVTTVIETIESPNGKYYAEIVDSDQGALGADTLVYIKRTNSINLLILKIAKQPKLLYHGDWKEYQNTQIEWSDNNTLIIDSTEYKINT